MDWQSTNFCGLLSWGYGFTNARKKWRDRVLPHVWTDNSNTATMHDNGEVLDLKRFGLQICTIL